MRSTPITAASGKLEMKRSRSVKRKRIETEKDKETRALEFVCHKKQRCLSIKANEERHGQADPEKSPAFLSEPEGPPVLHSLLHTSCHRGDPPLQSTFSHVCLGYASHLRLLKVSSFGLLLCLQQHHSCKCNIRNLLHSILDPAVPTIPAANFPLLRNLFTYSVVALPTDLHS